MRKDTIKMFKRLTDAGLSLDDAMTLRRISMTLQAWHEAECGTEYGCICRDEATGKPYWLSAMNNSRMPVRDREAGALKRLAAIMARYPYLTAYVQTDPRGAALYILRKADVVGDVESCYTNGIAVYK